MVARRRPATFIVKECLVATDERMTRARAVKLSAPPSLRSRVASAALRRAEQFFSAPAKQRAQKRFQFDDQLITPFLEEMAA